VQTISVWNRDGAQEPQVKAYDAVLDRFVLASNLPSNQKLLNHPCPAKQYGKNKGCLAEVLAFPLG
jgi:hypothetical protein